MSHGLDRLQSRFQADPSDVEAAQAQIAGHGGRNRPKNSV